MTVTAKPRIQDPFTDDELLHTGSSTLNLALTGKMEGGYLKGRYFYIVGDSSSGKTFFTLTALAEACRNPEFDDYRLIYDDVEGGALMDIEKYFGAKLAERIEPPAGSASSPKHSQYVEELYFHLDDAFNKKQPFIYVCDSQDALDSLAAEKKFKSMKTARRTNTKTAGEMTDGKAKYHSQRIRSVVSKLRDTDSILLLVNQTRDVLNSAPFGPKTQASGGRSLRFYATAQIWTTQSGKLYRTINSKKRQIGIEVKVAIKKNRLTGKEWSVIVPIYFSHGIDDVGGCVEFLCEEGRWSKNQNTGRIEVDPEDFENIAGSLDKVVEKLEEAGLEDEVRDITFETFQEVVTASQVKRKKRYS